MVLFDCTWSTEHVEPISYSVNFKYEWLKKEFFEEEFDLNNQE